ncbi:MAG: glycosyltransferase, partial [Actinomycetota bacterium]
EGLPLVLMESLALGLPIVATRVGGVPELVRDGIDGTLVPAQRPDLLAEAIDDLVVDRERRDRMSHAGAEGAMRFDNHEAVRTIEALYREVAATRRAHRNRR